MSAVRRLPGLLVALALAAVVLTGCGGDEAAAAPTPPVTGVTEVAAKDNQFRPGHPGPVDTTVTWSFMTASSPRRHRRRLDLG